MCKDFQPEKKLNGNIRDIAAEADGIILGSVLYFPSVFRRYFAAVSAKLLAKLGYIREVDRLERFPTWSVLVSTIIPG